MKSYTPQATNGGVFDVVSFKADPTGATDSAPAFQAAADALVAFNATDMPAMLLIPPGRYRLDSTVILSGGNAVVSAYGAYIFAQNNLDLFRDYTSQDTSYTLNGSGLTILGGVWDCKGHLKAQDSAGYSAFTLSNSSDVLFRDVTIRNVRSYHGIDLNTCNNVTVENVRCEGFKNSYEWKTDVVAASTANLSLTGAATVDGVALATGNRVLVKNQTTASQNGIYSANTAGAWSRATDMDADGEANDAAVKVTGGTTQAGMSFRQTTTGTVGVTAQTWSSYWKLQCRLASTANLSLTGAATVDGLAVVTGDRILVKNQTNSAQNGIYSANTAGAWTRTTDANSAALLNGASVTVTAGTVGAGGNFKQNSTITTLGTDPVTWGTEYRVNRAFSEAVQLDEGPTGTPCKNFVMDNSYMGPARDGSGLLSFGKLVGTHTDSPGILYENIKVTNNTSIDSLSSAISGYSWGDCLIANNVIDGSADRGIRLTFGSSNNGPRIAITGNVISQVAMSGIDVDGSTGQTFGDVMVANNVITTTVMAGSHAGVRLDTLQRAVISGNHMNLTGSNAQQGIFLNTCEDVVVTGNNIRGAKTQGVQIDGGTRNNINANTIYDVGQEGVWLSNATTRNSISGNTIIGAGRTTNATYGAIRLSANACNDNNITGNTIRKFGSGNEASIPILFSGAQPTGCTVNFNTFEGWSATHASNFTLNAAVVSTTIVAATTANNCTA